jgi:hypothetical protein
MPKMPNDYDDAAVGHGGPGTALRVVAAKLAAHGFDVRGPEWAEGRCLTVINLPGTTCEVTFEDHGFVAWEYWRGASKGADPDRVAARVVRLLTDDGADLPRSGTAARNLRAGLQGIVGRELEAKGLAVGLDVYADHVAFEVAAELVVTNPAHPERGQVRVGDEASLLWECGYCGAGRIDPGAIADTIIAILAADIADGYIQRGQAALACSGQANR